MYRFNTIYRVRPRPPLRQWNTTQHVQSQPETTIATMKGDIPCTESPTKHHYDNERRHTRYRVNHKTPVRQWKTTQHVQSQSQTTITTMKDDAASTESTTKHQFDNERQHNMYRVNPRPSLRQWKTTHQVQSQPQNTSSTMKDNTTCTESIPDNHYDNERRRSKYRVKPRPPLWQWKTTRYLQTQPQTTVTTMKDDAACTESIPDHHYDNERRHNMYIANGRPP